MSQPDVKILDGLIEQFNAASVAYQEAMNRYQLAEQVKQRAWADMRRAHAQLSHCCDEASTMYRELYGTPAPTDPK